MPEESLGINTDSGMPRICIRLPESYQSELEYMVEKGEFPNISEAIRYAIRKQTSISEKSTSS